MSNILVYRSIFFVLLVSISVSAYICQFPAQSLRSCHILTASSDVDYGTAEIDELCRKDLQKKCKSIGIKAIGSNQELRNRLREFENSILSREDNSNYNLSLDDKLQGSHYSDNEIIRSQHSRLSEHQYSQIEMFSTLLTEWNTKINLVSRRDIENLMSRHIIPSLSMAKLLNLADGSSVMDVGTGGGLPGIPLAIYYPNSSFTLIDTRSKKIVAVRDMAEKLGLKNVVVLHKPANEIRQIFDYIVGRAVTRLPIFISWVEDKLKRNDELGPIRGIPRGVIYMRGEPQPGELEELGVIPNILNLPGLEAVSNGNDNQRGYQKIMHFSTELLLSRK